MAKNLDFFCDGLHEIRIHDMIEYTERVLNRMTPNQIEQYQTLVKRVQSSLSAMKELYYRARREQVQRKFYDMRIQTVREQLCDALRNLIRAKRTQVEQKSDLLALPKEILLLIVEKSILGGSGEWFRVNREFEELVAIIQSRIRECTLKLIRTLVSVLHVYSRILPDPGSCELIMSKRLVVRYPEYGGITIVRPGGAPARTVAEPSELEDVLWRLFRIQEHGEWIRITKYVSPGVHYRSPVGIPLLPDVGIINQSALGSNGSLYVPSQTQPFKYPLLETNFALYYERERADRERHSFATLETSRFDSRKMSRFTYMELQEQYMYAIHEIEIDRDGINVSADAPIILVDYDKENIPEEEEEDMFEDL